MKYREFGKDRIKSFCIGIWNHETAAFGGWGHC